MSDLVGQRIQIKRSDTAPSDMSGLFDGEFGYVKNTNKLYIGRGVGVEPVQVNVTDNATTTTSGLMSAADKVKLNNLTDTGATKVTVSGSGSAITGASYDSATRTITLNKDYQGYTHPAGNAANKASGLYKFSTNSTSHVNSVTAVTKADITALGIPGSDTNTAHAHTAGAGLSISGSGGISGTTTYSLAESGVTADTYGPTAAVTGSEGTTINIPQITVDKYGRITGAINRTYTSKNTTYSNFVKSGSDAKAGLVPAPSTTAGTTKYLREDGTWAVPPDTNTTYSAAGTSLGLVKSGGDVTISSGTITVNDDSHNHVISNIDNLQTNLDNKLSLSGGNMTGHIYLTGAKTTSSTGNTSQIIFGTPEAEHVAISSNEDMIVINPSSASTTGQILLKLGDKSSFPHGIIANITGNLTGTASKATADASGNTITSTYETKTDATAKLAEAKAYTDTAVANLVDTAPEALNTLNELAAALGDDANFATTVSTNIGKKADSSITITAGNGLTGGGTLAANRTLAVGAGTGISVSADAVSLDTVDDLTAGTYGPSANVSGSNNATMNVPEITVDTYGRVTKVTNRVYTSKNTTYSNATTTTSGLMSAEDKVKLNGITADADAVSYSQSVTSGTKIGAITINGSATNIYVPNLSGGKAEAADTSVVSGVTVSGHAVTVANKNISGNKGIAAAGTADTITVGHNTTGGSDVTQTAGKAVTKLTIDDYGHVTATGTSDIINSIETTGNGNAITAASSNNGVITFTKGSTFKTVQDAVSSPSASGTTVSFIDTISQDTNGVITATKKTVRTMGKASASAAGSTGLVPQPKAGDHNKYLRGDGTWASVIPTNGTAEYLFAADSNSNGYWKNPDDVTVGNADYAQKAASLDGSRKINGTVFDNTKNITTSSWGTGRTIEIKDHDGTNAGSVTNADDTTSINGGQNIKIRLPSKIKATSFVGPLTGNVTGNLTGTADKAKQDGSGNTITSTYLKLSGGTMTGSIKMNATQKGYYLMDSTGYSYAALWNNASNLWIGATAAASQHHTGGTYISSGYSGTTGNPSIYVSIPNDTNDGATSHAVVHAGNYTDYQVDQKVKQGRSTASTWRALLSHYNNVAAGTDPGTVTNGVYYNENIAVQYSTGTLSATKVKGAVWNDYAEYRTYKDSDEIPYGRIVVENGDDTLSLSTERLQKGGNVCSDTFGFYIGETEKAQMPIAVSGRALVYTNEDRNSYQPGDAVCTGPNGTISKMTREEIKEYPDCIIGYVSAVPQYDIWGETNIKVDNRIWIKVV